MCRQQIVTYEGSLYMYSFAARICRICRHWPDLHAIIRMPSVPRNMI